MSPVIVALPEAAETLLSRFCIAFTPRTFQRVVLLFVGSVLVMGRVTRSPGPSRRHARLPRAPGTSPTTTASSPAPAGHCGHWGRCGRRWCWSWCRRTSPATIKE